MTMVSQPKRFSGRQIHLRWYAWLPGAGAAVCIGVLLDRYFGPGAQIRPFHTNAVGIHIAAAQEMAPSSNTRRGPDPRFGAQVVTAHGSDRAVSILTETSRVVAAPVLSRSRAQSAFLITQRSLRREWTSQGR